MKKLLKYPLNMQMFADPGTGSQPNPNPDDPTPATSHEIDYDKLAEAISKRTAVSENSALKGYLKEQGLSKEEIDEAVKTYKTNQANKAKEEQEKIDKILKENASYKQKELMRNVESEAQKIAKELGVRDDRFKSLMRLCDNSKFLDEKGVIDKDAIKSEMETQLKDVPEFKASKRVTITSGTNRQTAPDMTEDEEYRKRKYGKSKYFRG